MDKEVIYIGAGLVTIITFVLVLFKNVRITVKKLWFRITRYKPMTCPPRIGPVIMLD